MRVTIEQLHKLHDEIRAGRVNCANFQSFLENPNRFCGDLGRWGQYYPVEIDYSRDVDNLVKANRFDWKNGDVNTKNFPFQHKGKNAVKLELASFDETVTGEEAAKRLQADGYTLEDIGALLTFGLKYPDEQRKRPIVALGSRWQDRVGDVRVPCLAGVGSARSLHLYRFVSVFGPGCRFLVSRKSPT